jgi:hypothetical protein
MVRRLERDRENNARKKERWNKQVNHTYLRVRNSPENTVF